MNILIGLKVKAARIHAGITQKEAAQTLNLSLAGYAKKENGKTKFYLDEIIALSNLFGMDINEFYQILCQ